MTDSDAVDPSSSTDVAASQGGRSRPLVSVVTPSYNQREFIEDTIESVRRQSYPDVEHVVVDGESDDGVLELLSSVDYDGLRWISEPDEGQADAINKGFDMATGEVVGWLNSDDVYFDREVLSRVVEYFDRTGADVVYGDIAIVDADSTVRNVQRVPDFDREKLRRYCFIDQPAVFFRSHVLEGERLDERLEYAIDYEFWLRLSSSYEFRHVDDVLAADRNHPGRKILRDRAAMQAETERVRRDYGGPTGTDYRIGRIGDVTRSGIPRRVGSMIQSLRLARDPPVLAFDGEYSSPLSMAIDALRPNRTVVE